MRFRKRMPPAYITRKTLFTGLRQLADDVFAIRTRSERLVRSGSTIATSHAGERPDRPARRLPDARAVHSSGHPTKDVSFNAVDTSIQEKLKPVVPRPEDFQLWETCMTINNTWAYIMHDREFKSAQFLIRGLVEVASRGRNFLLKVGPQPDGVIQPEFQERLHAIGDWLRVNGDSIYGTTYGPIQGQTAYRSTAKEGTVFLHVFDWPGSALTVTGVDPKTISARLVSTGQQLKFQQRVFELTPFSFALAVRSPT